MKRNDETFLNKLRAREREKRNAELARRLEISRTTEDMIYAFRSLEPIGKSECAVAQVIRQKKEFSLA